MFITWNISQLDRKTADGEAALMAQINEKKQPKISTGTPWSN